MIKTHLYVSGNSKSAKLTSQLVLCAGGAFWGVGGELILVCLCDGKEEVVAKPLCEVDPFSRFRFSAPFLILPPSFGQSLVETGHRWSLVGRDWDQDGGTSIAALVAFSC